jgi:hypothetical protein
MTRVHFVKKARKDYPDHDIKRGDSYYWWQFRFGGKNYSKISPKPSQLTQSDFLSQVYGFQEQLDDLTKENDVATLYEEVQSIAGDIRTLGEEQSDKLSNMPDSLQGGTIGELLQSRADACEDWASELEGVEQPELEDGASDDDKESAVEEYLEEIAGLGYAGE